MLFNYLSFVAYIACAPGRHDVGRVIGKTETREKKEDGGTIGTKKKPGAVRIQYSTEYLHYNWPPLQRGF